MSFKINGELLLQRGDASIAIKQIRDQLSAAPLKLDINVQSVDTDKIEKSIQKVFDTPRAIQVKLAGASLSAIRKQIKDSFATNSVDVNIGASTTSISAITAKLKKALSAKDFQIKINIDSGVESRITAIDTAIQKLTINLRQAVIAASALSDAFTGLSRAAASTNAATRNVAQNINSAAKSQQALNRATASNIDTIQTFSDRVNIAAKRIVAYGSSAFAIYTVVNALQAAAKEAISFQNQLTKLAQLGTTTSEIEAIDKQIRKLAGSLGVSSSALVRAAETFKQAGLSGSELKNVLDGIAAADVAPTFGTIEETTEGLVAIFNQFGLATENTTKILSQLNAVSARYAVESSDFIEAAKLSGSAFKQAGGTFEEFLGVLTAVRSTTRLSANTIGQGLKTIFTRTQDARVIDQLRNLGVELQDLGTGKIKTPIEALKELARAVEGLPSGDNKISQIATAIGGVFQVGKLIPLLTNLDVALEATGVALSASSDLFGVQLVAQQSFERQLIRVNEQFNTFVSNLLKSKQLASFTRDVLAATSGLEGLGNTLGKVIPQLIQASTVAATAVGIGSLASAIGSRGVGGVVDRRGVGSVVGVASTFAGESIRSGFGGTAGNIAGGAAEGAGIAILLGSLFKLNPIVIAVTASFAALNSILQGGINAATDPKENQDAIRDIEESLSNAFSKIDRDLASGAITSEQFRQRRIEVAQRFVSDPNQLAAQAAQIELVAQKARNRVQSGIFQFGADALAAVGFTSQQEARNRAGESAQREAAILEAAPLLEKNKLAADLLARSGQAVPDQLIQQIAIGSGAKDIEGLQKVYKEQKKYYEDLTKASVEVTDTTKKLRDSQLKYTDALNKSSDSIGGLEGFVENIKRLSGESASLTLSSRNTFATNTVGSFSPELARNLRGALKLEDILNTEDVVSRIGGSSAFRDKANTGETAQRIAAEEFVNEVFGADFSGNLRDVLISEIASARLDIDTDLPQRLTKIIDEQKKQGERVVQSLEAISAAALKTAGEIREFEQSIVGVNAQANDLNFNRDRSFAEIQAKVAGADSSRLFRQTNASQLFEAQIGNLTGGLGLDQIPGAISQLQARLQQLREDRANAPDSSAQAQFQIEIDQTSASINRLTDALKFTADESGRLAELQERIAEATDARNQKERASLSIAERFLTGDSSERANIRRGIQGANLASSAVQGSGDLSAFRNVSLLRETLAVLRQVGTAEFGTSGVSGQFIADELVRRLSGFTPVGQIEGREGALELEQARIQSINSDLENIGGLVGQYALIQDQQVNALTELTKVFQREIDVRNSFLDRIGTRPTDTGVVAPEAKAFGGKMRAVGSDTVPAMLTPGEFVVNAQSARANRDILERINSKKQPLLLAGGGPVGPRGAVVTDPKIEAVLDDLEKKFGINFRSFATQIGFGDTQAGRRGEFVSGGKKQGTVVISSALKEKDILRTIIHELAHGADRLASGKASPSATQATRFASRQPKSGFGSFVSSLFGGLLGDTLPKSGFGDFVSFIEKSGLGVGSKDNILKRRSELFAEVTSAILSGDESKLKVPKKLLSEIKDKFAAEVLPELKRLSKETSLIELFDKSEATDPTVKATSAKVKKAIKPERVTGTAPLEGESVKSDPIIQKIRAESLAAEEARKLEREEKRTRRESRKSPRQKRIESLRKFLGIDPEVVKGSQKAVDVFDVLESRRESKAAAKAELAILEKERATDVDFEGRAQISVRNRQLLQRAASALTTSASGPAFFLSPSEIARLAAQEAAGELKPTDAALLAKEEVAQLKAAGKPVPPSLLERATKFDVIPEQQAPVKRGSIAEFRAARKAQQASAPQPVAQTDTAKLNQTIPRQPGTALVPVGTVDPARTVRGASQSFTASPANTTPDLRFPQRLRLARSSPQLGTIPLGTDAPFSRGRGGSGRPVLIGGAPDVPGATLLDANGNPITDVPVRQQSAGSIIPVERSGRTLSPRELTSLRLRIAKDNAARRRAITAQNRSFASTRFFNRSGLLANESPTILDPSPARPLILPRQTSAANLIFPEGEYPFYNDPVSKNRFGGVQRKPLILDPSTKIPPLTGTQISSRPAVSGPPIFGDLIDDPNFLDKIGEPDAITSIEDFELRRNLALDQINNRIGFFQADRTEYNDKFFEEGRALVELEDQQRRDIERIIKTKYNVPNAGRNPLEPSAQEEFLLKRDRSRPFRREIAQQRASRNVKLPISTSEFQRRIGLTNRFSSILKFDRQGSTASGRARQQQQGLTRPRFNPPGRLGNLLGNANAGLNRAFGFLGNIANSSNTDKLGALGALALPISNLAEGDNASAIFTGGATAGLLATGIGLARTAAIAPLIEVLPALAKGEDERAIGLGLTSLGLTSLTSGLFGAGAAAVTAGGLAALPVGVAGSFVLNKIAEGIEAKGDIKYKVRPPEIDELVDKQYNEVKNKADLYATKIRAAKTKAEIDQILAEARREPGFLTDFNFENFGDSTKPINLQLGEPGHAVKDTTYFKVAIGARDTYNRLEAEQNARDFELAKKQREEAKILFPERSEFEVRLDDQLAKMREEEKKRSEEFEKTRLRAPEKSVRVKNPTVKTPAEHLKEIKDEVARRDQEKEFEREREKLLEEARANRLSEEDRRNRLIKAGYIRPDNLPLNPKTFASGGVVRKGTDTVPALLTPGEFVVNARDTRKNRDLLERINKGRVQGYASGGYVEEDEEDIPGRRRKDRFEIASNGRNVNQKYKDAQDAKRAAFLKTQKARKDAFDLRAAEGKNRSNPDFIGPTLPKGVITTSTATPTRASVAANNGLIAAPPNKAQAAQAQKQQEAKGIDPNALTQFATVFSASVDKLTNLVNTLSTLELNHKLDAKINGKIEVILNGAQVLATLEPKLQELIETQVQGKVNEIEQMIQKKLNGPQG